MIRSDTLITSYGLRTVIDFVEYQFPACTVGQAVKMLCER